MAPNPRYLLYLDPPPRDVDPVTDYADSVGLQLPLHPFFETKVEPSPPSSNVIKLG